MTTRTAVAFVACGFAMMGGSSLLALWTDPATVPLAAITVGLLVAGVYATLIGVVSIVHPDEGKR